MTYKERKELRAAVADYMSSEGCSCCQNVEAHPELHEFIMSMGTCFFTDNTVNRCVVRDEDLEEHADVFDIIDKYDEDYHLTGIPMRFTAMGPVVHNW